MKRRLKLLLLLLFASAALALTPGDLRVTDALFSALYHTEPFQDESAFVPNTPAESRQKLNELIAKDPASAPLYKELAEIEIQLLEFGAAETHMRQYVEKSAGKDQAFSDLESFYHQRLRFADEVKARNEHALALTPEPGDVTAKTGRYAIYQSIVSSIDSYGLPDDPKVVYLASIQSYPSEEQPTLDYLEYLKGIHQQAAALQLLETFKQKFPSDQETYLLTRASLLKPDEAFDFLSKQYDPLWDVKLIQALDSYAASSGKKGDYLAGLKARLQKNPLDFDAATRLFYAFYNAENLTEAQNALNDFRLLKDQKDQKDQWSPQELYVLAKLQQLLTNYNEAARYYYALFVATRSGNTKTGVKPDDALYGLYQVLLAAEDRPVQLSAGNLDYYKDIATADSNPGVLNGLLSLIFNSNEPSYEFEQQEQKATGYFNRAQAFRLLQYTQRTYPSSGHLPAMASDCLKIYEKYGMDQLILSAGEQFFKTYPDSGEILEVGIAMADVYARAKEHEKEWQIYQRLLPIAAKREQGKRLLAHAQGQTLNYESILNRYIGSLTDQKNYMAVVQLYRDQIGQHPDEQALYENFTSYLSQNNLFDDEVEVYRQAIDRFKQQSWYEKLARWYLRHERKVEFEKTSRAIVDLFRGTEVQTYLDTVVGSEDPYRDLYLSLNLYAHEKFPLNMHFVNNLLAYHVNQKRPQWAEWESLSKQYYFLDESIRNGYLQYLSKNDRLPRPGNPANAVQKRFAADEFVWRSHFEESVPIYEDLASSYVSESDLNLRLADLKRSLGVQDAGNYAAAAKIRERLAQITPSDSALWTTAGESLADVEQYEGAKAYWRKILEIEPRNPDRYLEVATILWDYYLFDDALATLERARKIKDDPTFFAYEAGAIQESKRDYPRAITEYAKSLIADSEAARRRLGELYQRKTLAPQVRQELDLRLQQNAQDPDWWLGVIRFYLDQKERDTAEKLIARALATLQPEPFSRAAESLRKASSEHGFYAEEEQILQTQIKRASSDADRLSLRIELARFYESRDRDSNAESVYAALYHEQPRSAGIIDELLSYYWRSKQYAKAFAVYQEILPAANENFKKKYLLEAAGRRRERGDLDEALVYAKQLYAADPLNAGYFGLIAKLLAEKHDYAALSDHYKTGLTTVRKSDLPANEKKERIAGLRAGIIEADVILKDYTAALDQYIEIINGDPEEEGTLQQAAQFGTRYGLFPRLVEYYNKTAAASPRDHRWPMVLGRLHIFSGEYDESVKEFQAAIAIHPERTDFYEQLALSYQRLGKYQEAIDAYTKLYAMTYKNKRWLEPLADLNARIGKKQQAIEYYTATLTDQTELQKNLSLSTKTLHWGLVAESVQYGEAALREYESDRSQELDADGLNSYLEALFQSGKELDALRILQQTYDGTVDGEKDSTFDTEALRSAEYMLKAALTTEFPALVKKYLTGDRKQALQEAILANALGNLDRCETLYLPLVTTAGMAPAQDRIQQEMSNAYYRLHKTEDDDGWNKYRSMRSQIKDFYEARGAYLRSAGWLSEQWNRSSRHPDFRGDLVEIADAYRTAGKQDQELAALAEYYAFGAEYELDAASVERYLSLLYDLNQTDQLKAVAAHANLPAANYFAKRGDKQMAIAAIESLARNKPAVWNSMEQAMLGRQLRDPSFDPPFRAGLDLRSIGEQLDQPTDEKSSVLGDDWFFYATRYGEYLWWTARKTDAVFYLPSDLEAMPTNGGPHNKLGHFYFDEKDFASALQQYTLAVEMIPKASRFLDDRARALAKLGKKDEAIAAWKKMVQDVSSTLSYELLVQSAIDNAFVDSVRADVETFLEKKIETSGATGLETLLPLYLKTVPQSSLPPLLDRWIAAAPAPKDFANELLQYDFLDAGARLRIYRTAAEYLNNWMGSAVTDELDSVRWEVTSWNKSYAEELLDAEQYDSALSTVSTALEASRKRENSDSDTERDLALLKIRILLRMKQKEQAMQAIKDFVTTTGTWINKDLYTSAAAVLKEEGQEAESRALLGEMYEKLLAAGQTESANYIGLAEIRLDQQQPDEAREILRRLIFLNSENLEGMDEAAALFEKKQMWTGAAEYREDLNRRSPWNTQNRALLAEDLWKAGQKERAEALAVSVLKTTASDVDSMTRATRIAAQGAAPPAGPPEMQAVIALLRGGRPNPDLAQRPYYYVYRTIALENSAQKPVDLLLAQRFLSPDDKQTTADLFRAYAGAGQCVLALATVDPEKTRFGEYYPEESQSSDEESYDEEGSGSGGNPIESLLLEEDQTKQLALQAAQCALQEKDLNGQLFFLQMAWQHTDAEAEQQKLQEQIDRVKEQIADEEDKENRRFKVTENLGREA